MSERTTPASYLPPGLPAPAAAAEGLDRPYWDALREPRPAGQLSL